MKVFNEGIWKMPEWTESEYVLWITSKHEHYAGGSSRFKADGSEEYTGHSVHLPTEVPTLFSSPLAQYPERQGEPCAARDLGGLTTEILTPAFV